MKLFKKTKQMNKQKSRLRDQTFLLLLFLHKRKNRNNLFFVLLIFNVLNSWHIFSMNIYPMHIHVVCIVLYYWAEFPSTNKRFLTVLHRTFFSFVIRRRSIHCFTPFVCLMKINRILLKNEMMFEAEVVREQFYFAKKSEIC